MSSTILAALAGMTSLSVLLPTCPELCFIDLTYILGEGSGLVELARLVHMLRQ